MRHSRERGQAVVEFAIAGTLALTLIFAVVDFGRALYEYDLVAQAARVATRYAIVNAATCATTTDYCKAAITAQLVAKPGIDPTRTTVTPLWQTNASGATCYDPGCTVMVSVAYVFSFVALPFPSPTFRSASKVVIAR